MNKYKFKIRNLDGANAMNKLEIILKKIDIINNISISFMAKKLTLDLIKKVIKKEKSDIILEEV